MPGPAGPGPRGAAPGAEASAQAFPRLRAVRMICVTSYRLRPSLLAISSGRRPCWLYRTASRRCEAVPGSRGWLGEAGPPRAGLPWGGVAWAGVAWAGVAWAGVGLGWCGLGWCGLGRPALGWCSLGRPALDPGGRRAGGARLGLAEGAAPLVVILAPGQVRLGVLVQQQVLLGRLVDPHGHHGQALEVLGLAFGLHAVVVFLRPLGMLVATKIANGRLARRLTRSVTDWGSWTWKVRSRPLQNSSMFGTSASHFGPSADDVFEANLGFECGIRRMERHTPRLIADNAIGRDMTPPLERLNRGSRVRPEVAVNALRRRVPLSGRSAGQHLLKAADDVAG